MSLPEQFGYFGHPFGSAARSAGVEGDSCSRQSLRYARFGMEICFLWMME